jgi:hypothetical protein
MRNLPVPEPPRPCFQLVLEALESSNPVSVRLRLLLKTALRTFRLRCISCEEIQAPEDADDKQRPS